jgi:hypothetical protein
MRVSQVPASTSGCIWKAFVSRGGSNCTLLPPPPPPLVLPLDCRASCCPLLLLDCSASCCCVLVVLSSCSHFRHDLGRWTPVAISNCPSKNGHATVPGPFGLSTGCCKTDASFEQFMHTTDHFTKTGSGQTHREASTQKEICVFRGHLGGAGRKHSNFDPVRMNEPTICNNDDLLFEFSLCFVPSLSW